MPVSSAHDCYTAARHGPRTPGKKGAWTPSTWEASAVSWECRCKTRCPTLKSCLAQVSIFTLLRQWRLRWLCYVHRIPKDLLYRELVCGKRPTGRPLLRYRDVLKRDMKAVDINTESWESLAANRSKWREALTKLLKSGEEKLTQTATERRGRRKQSDSLDRPETEHRTDLYLSVTSI